LQRNVTVNTRSIVLSDIIISGFGANLLSEPFWRLFGRSAVGLVWRMFRSICLVGWIDRKSYISTICQDIYLGYSTFQVLVHGGTKNLKTLSEKSFQKNRFE
jgi:hypothetical protein